MARIYRIISDLDNTVFNLDAEMERRVRRSYPDIKIMPRSHFLFEDDYPEDVRPLIRAIWAGKDARGFFASLQPYPGAIESIKEIMSEGYEVLFCSFAGGTNPWMIPEKIASLEHYFGDKVIFRSEKDKTNVDGDVIVDDCPDLRGARTPIWKHVIYDQPCNRDVPGPRMYNWRQWRGVILPLLGAG